MLKLSPKLRGGRLFFLWLILYNGVRFFLENVRMDSTFIYGIRLNSIVSAALFAVGIIGLYALHVYTKEPSDT